MHGGGVRGVDDLSSWTDQLLRRVCVPGRRSDALWCLRHGLSRRADLHVGPVPPRDDLPDGSDGLRRDVRGHCNEFDELRDVRTRLQRRRRLHGRYVRTGDVPCGTDSLRLGVCGYAHGRRELRGVWRRVHGGSELRRGSLSGELCGAADVVLGRRRDDLCRSADGREQLRLVRSGVCGRARVFECGLRVLDRVLGLRRFVRQHRHGRRQLRYVRPCVRGRSHVCKRGMRLQHTALGLRWNVHADLRRFVQLWRVWNPVQRGADVLERGVRDVCVPGRPAQLRWLVREPCDGQRSLWFVYDRLRCRDALHLERVSSQQRRPRWRRADHPGHERTGGRGQHCGLHARRPERHLRLHVQQRERLVFFHSRNSRGRVLRHDGLEL